MTQIAQTLDKAAIWARGFLARFGGEEFMLVLPETDAKGAALMAQHCHEAIKQLAIPHSQSSISDQLTVSIGVCTLVLGADDDLQHFINRVDGLLYTAKKDCRNRSAFEK